MRVTSTIRDYVHREVKKKIDSKHHTEIKAYEDACDEAIAFLKDFRNAYTDFTKEYFKKADKEKFDIRLPDPAFYPMVTIYNPHPESGYLKPKNKPDYNAITNEINTEVDNILIALELGATKAELDEMLEAL